MSNAVLIVIYTGSAILTLLPLWSWALGRWYQAGLVSKLNENEKLIGSILDDKMSISTSNKISLLGAEYSTLLHVSLCVGPSVGQIFFMWLKSLFGGRLHSYDIVLDFGRREALLRLKQQAAERGCTSIVNIRIETSVVSLLKPRRASRPQ